MGLFLDQLYCTYLLLLFGLIRVTCGLLKGRDKVMRGEANHKMSANQA